jgi:CubicO group peptidase (beta-lactamase class C family)
MERFYGDFVSEQPPAQDRVPGLHTHTKNERDWVRPMVAQPSIKWHYGPGTDLAGRVVEKTSNQALEQYIHDHIWSPLGIHLEKRPSFPSMLEMGNQDPSDGPVTPGEFLYPVPASNQAGGVGLFFNAEDYAKLLAAL